MLQPAARLPYASEASPYPKVVGSEPTGGCQHRVADDAASLSLPCVARRPCHTVRSQAGANQFASPVVDAPGGLDIGYAAEDCNTSLDRGLYFKRSTDGGASFGAHVRIDRPGEWADNPNTEDRLPAKKARIGDLGFARVQPGQRIARLRLPERRQALDLRDGHLVLAVEGLRRDLVARPDAVDHGDGRGGAAGPVLPVDRRRRGRWPARDLVRQPRRPERPLDRDVPGRLVRRWCQLAEREDLDGGVRPEPELLQLWLLHRRLQRDRGIHRGDLSRLDRRT